MQLVWVHAHALPLSSAGPAVLCRTCQKPKPSPAEAPVCSRDEYTYTQAPCWYLQDLLATAREAQNEQQAATQVVLDEYEQQVSQRRERADATSNMFAAAEASYQ